MLSSFYEFSGPEQVNIKSKSNKMFRILLDWVHNIHNTSYIYNDQIYTPHIADTLGTVLPKEHKEEEQLRYLT